MLAHPRSHSLYALACLGVWSTYWVRPTFRRHDCRLRIRMAAARHHCSPPLFLLSQAILIAFSFFFRCPSCRHFVFCSGRRLAHPARQESPRRARHCSMGRSCARNCSPSRVHLCALRRDMHRKGLSSAVTPKGLLGLPFAIAIAEALFPRQRSELHHSAFNG